MNLNPYAPKANKLPYSAIFAMSKIIAKTFIDSKCDKTEEGYKMFAHGFDCSWQLIKTFVWEYHENSHLKNSLYGQVR